MYLDIFPKSIITWSIFLQVTAVFYPLPIPTCFVEGGPTQLRIWDVKLCQTRSKKHLAIYFRFILEMCLFNHFAPIGRIFIYLWNTLGKRRTMEIDIILLTVLQRIIQNKCNGAIFTRWPKNFYALFKYYLFVRMEISTAMKPRGYQKKLCDQIT